jgi:DNA-binding transcriptional ArsR family regulator
VIDREEMERCAQRLKAFTEPHRLMIVVRLLQGDATVTELAVAAGLNISMASHNLSILLKVGLVGFTRKGRHVHYFLHPDVVRLKDGKRLPIIDLGLAVLEFEQDVPAVPTGGGFVRID